MGMVGTTPAAGRVLLVGDAAGLINPLQGEGIAQGMRSGQLAAETLLAGPGRGGRALHRRPGGRAPPVPADHRRPAGRAGGPALGRGRGGPASSPRRRPATRSPGGWAVFWNELLDGAPPGRHRSVAAAFTRLGDALTSRTAVARWFEPLLQGAAAPAPA